LGLEVGMGRWWRAIQRSLAARRRLRRLRARGTLTAKGFGGSLELQGNRLKISKGGVFGLLVSLLGFEGGFTERVFRVNQISAVEIDKPILFFRYMRISYPGAPQQSGNNLRDVMAENAILMSFFDNRPFYRIIAGIERMMETTD
jgi:hypothetical protein